MTTIASRSELDRLTNGDTLTLPSRDSSMWDEWYCWAARDRKRLARFMGGGLEPDVLATDLGVSVDEALRQWRAACFVALDGGASDQVDAAEWELDHAARVLAEILGPHEVGELLDVAVGTVHQWAKRRRSTRFPYAARTVSGIPLWTRDQILGWAAQTGRVQDIPDESF